MIQGSKVLTVSKERMRRQHYGVEALEALMNCFIEGKRCRGVGGNVSI